MLFSYVSQCIRLLITQTIFYFSGLIPKQHKAVMGCYKNKFADNSKYLFLHWQQQKTITAIWISGDKALIKQLTQQGYLAYYRWSLMGIFHALTAKYYIYNSYIGDINQYFAKGAIKINLWHGSPLKQIEFDISNGPLHSVYHPSTLAQKLNAKALNHQQHVKPDLMLAASETVKNLFSSSFKLTDEQFLSCGNPRTDYYRYYEINNHQAAITNKDIRHVILYAPSWRDSSLANARNNIYAKAINFKELSKQLVNQNQLLLLRLHPNEAHFAAELDGYPNIINITHWDDIYGIINKIDLLITDYSSIYIDALQYKCNIAFFPFDKAHYHSECRSEYSYVANLPAAGPSVYNFAELQNMLKDKAASVEPTVNLGDLSKQSFCSQQTRQVLINTFWQDSTNALDCLDELVTQGQKIAVKKPTQMQAK